MNAQLIPAKEEDISQIIALARKIWQAHYPPIIGQIQVDYMLNLLYSADALQQQMQEGQHFYFVVADGEKIGFVAISQKTDDEYFIHKFYIDTNEHRKGIGADIFSKLTSLYKDVKIIRLQVNRQNYKPINFYFKVGFVIERVADFDIGNGYWMNDFVMVWHRK